MVFGSYRVKVFLREQGGLWSSLIILKSTLKIGKDRHIIDSLSCISLILMYSS
ncbi:hypothetical protein NC651_028514 [Populus alba x Populus x berolinensis]|nr:hypothetical protein NC651_028514 [Populus alba x Populus x berolinensis]